QVRRSHAAVLTECNEVFARELNAETTADVIGMRLGNLEASKNEAAHYDYVKAFVDSDYRLSNYDLIYRAANGDERAVRSSLTGIVHDGLLLRFWGAESNIQDIRQAKAALRNREQYQELLAEVSTRLLTTRFDDAEQAVKDCLRKICTFIGADRTAIIWYDKSQHSARLLYAWSTIDSNFDIPSSVPEFPWIKGRLKSNVVIRVDDVNNVADDSRSEWAWFRRRGVKSFVLIPLVIDGEFVGASTFSHLQNTRAWSDQDIVDLRVFTELLASVLVRIRSRKALDDALAGLQRATDRLEAENVYLRQEIKRTHGFDEIIGQSDGILRCLHKVEQVADTLTPVLVLGETGTGKELIARAIHEHSDRSAHPLVKVNCAALPGDLIESELFGYEKGAFTGAHRHKRGRFDLADGSTLFLDEIGDIPIELQAKLLRVLQEGEFERLGGTETIKVDVRIVAATNRDLEQSVAAGEFRSDLYYRINTFPIELPPLREREDDVQLLAEHFATVHAKSLGREIRAISANMVEQLRKYHWPGNVRELDGVIQRAMISSSGEILELADPLVGYGTDDAFDQPRILSSTIAELKIVERDHIVSVLEGCGWKISGASGAASKLGIPPSTLRSKMKKLQIERPL
ncbi:MAG: sigma 54-interacting transcriptional regulator, partial [Gammaproteobacteria bacterium]|nr:sigma 54-interacting transcriptional regulator [Gammaproteobacteria bacterium]